MSNTAPPEIGIMEMKTGLSLSRCIPQIALGIVAEDKVEKIITATRYNSEEKWKLAEDKLAKGDWAAHPEAVNILRRLRAAGKIVQPLLDKGQKPILPTNGSIWISAEEEDDLQWTAVVPVSEESPAKIASDPIAIQDDPTPVVVKTRDEGGAVSKKSSPTRKSVISVVMPTEAGTATAASTTPVKTGSKGFFSLSLPWWLGGKKK